MFSIKKIGIKIYDYRGEFKGYSNLIHIAKKKVRNGKKDIEGAMYGVFSFKVTPFKDGYKLSKNPISFNY